MSQVTLKVFDLVYEARNEQGTLIEKKHSVSDVIGDAFYEGCFFCLKLKNDEVFRIHVERCVTIQERILSRDAVSAPAI